MCIKVFIMLFIIEGRMKGKEENRRKGKREERRRTGNNLIFNNQGMAT